MAAKRRSGWWRGPALLCAVVAAFAGPCGEPAGRDARFGPPASEPVPARVLDVTDGDTIRVRVEWAEVENVRYIGVDTPESTPDQPLECFGHEAAAANERLVGGRTVLLRFGPERRDDYGRLLAYVQVDRHARTRSGGRARALSVNDELVREGFARTLAIAPNDARAPRLARLEAAAGRAGRGLWAACAE